MKTKQFILTAIFTILTLSAFNACSDDGDTTKPVIVLNSPAEGDTIKIGEEVHLDMDLSDNEMLASYKVNLHANFDGHNHSHEITLRFASHETEDFEFNQSWNISGNKNIHIHHHEITIPENSTTGSYHFIVYCTDEAGNESYVARNIIIN